MQGTSATASQQGRVSLSPIPRAGTAERKNHPAARELARLLNYYRRRKRLSIEALARESGIDAAQIRRFESASHAPDIDELFQLAAAFGVEAWKIMKRLRVCIARLEDIDNAP